MRWDEQRTENDLRLPGVGDGPVVRTFDAPEAMGINFHEVRTRSALNHVPGGRYGFNYTVNPFRGCTHFCFARSLHTYLDFDAGRDFEREIVVKVNVPEVLRAETPHLFPALAFLGRAFVQKVERALAGIFVIAKAAEPCAVANAPGSCMVIADFYDQLRTQSDPL